MGIGVFILAVIVLIYRAVSSEIAVKNLAEYEKWNDPNYDKIEQDRIFDYYLKRNPRCHEQEFLTTWELYQKAQMELKSKGYKWNPAWDEYTPSPDKKEYVKGTLIAHKKYCEKNHKVGANVDKQLKVFALFICADGNNYEKNSLFEGMTQYEIYEFVKAAYNGQILTKYKENERFVEVAKRIRYNDFLCIIGSKQGKNEYDEALVWYDELMPFVPKKDYYPYPTQEYRNHHKIGDGWGINEEMAKSCEGLSVFKYHKINHNNYKGL